MMMVGSQPETYSNLLNLRFLENSEENVSTDGNAYDKQQLILTYEEEEEMIEEMLTVSFGIITENNYSNSMITILKAKEIIQHALVEKLKKESS